MSTAVSALSIKKSPLSVFLQKNLSGWMMLLPSVILFSFFMWVPLFESIQLSLYKAQGMRFVQFVGLQNYFDVFAHPDFMPAIVNTFMYTFWSLIIGFLVPVITAILINEVRKGKSLFKIGIYLPNIVPGMAMILMWSFIFKPGDTGILNILLKFMGIPSQAWLTNPEWTIPLIVLTLTWKGAGATALLYIAGLQGIDPELYEAAIIDGAGIWRRIRHITLPNIYNLARTMFVLQIIAVFQILYEPLVLTNGGPNNASISIMQLVFRYAFQQFDYPKAAAVSVIISLILAVLTALSFKLNKVQDM